MAAAQCLKVASKESSAELVQDSGDGGLEVSYKELGVDPDHSSGGLTVCELSSAELGQGSGGCGLVMACGVSSAEQV